MILEVRAVAPFFKNGFVVGCERTREAVLIDPGDEADALLSAVRSHGLDVRYVLLTHAHIDHITGVALVREALGAPVHLHRGDQSLYEHAVEQGQLFGLEVVQPPPCTFPRQSPRRSCRRRCNVSSVTKGVCYSRERSLRKRVILRKALL